MTASRTGLDRNYASRISLKTQTTMAAWQAAKIMRLPATIMQHQRPPPAAMKVLLSAVPLPGQRQAT
nr:MAG TPA: hypothetical protein [Caudoviricetes sp.]